MYVYIITISHLKREWDYGFCVDFEDFEDFEHSLHNSNET